MAYLKISWLYHTSIGAYMYISIQTQDDYLQKGKKKNWE